ncbi:hypothetical protein D917_06775 [Trichinella nativa]|uniref:Uncharacterized protein n=1 Tax=Trichinella nativa TaxID=6335 RepID=A0A1Y3EV25_9BILA|nr:hypothetical protein D917_06775 [Trichinella nativa]
MLSHVLQHAPTVPATTSLTSSKHHSRCLFIVWTVVCTSGLHVCLGVIVAYFSQFLFDILFLCLVVIVLADDESVFSIVRLECKLNRIQCPVVQICKPSPSTASASATVFFVYARFFFFQV